MENGKPVIYVRLDKALYGTLQATYLFWKNLPANLTSMGFVTNSYEECVVNKDIKGSQCTILWHVDDLNISHASQDVIDSILDDLNETYGKEAPLTFTKGKVHEYLSMTIDYSMDGKIMFIMDRYVMEILDEVPACAEFDRIAATPAAEHLFDVNTDDPELLDEETSQYFHTTMAKMLFLCKRARPDIQEPVTFLTTRVRAPDKDNYRKLGRAVKYLRQFPDLPLTLEADDTHIIKWWIDAAFAVHKDMRSHTGVTMSMGKGSVMSSSIQQKLNTISSTEVELVAVCDAMPMII